MPPKKSLSQPEDPNRSIFLTSSVSRESYNALFPKICKLKAQSADPIYLYIDSLGGSPFYASRIHELIIAPRHDGSICELVVVAPSIAASAAADLLILGDYSIVNKNTIVHCHGTRYSQAEVTADKVLELEKDLHQTDRSHAVRLSSRVIDRICFLILSENNLLEQDGKSLIKDAKQYLQYIYNRLSPQAKSVVDRALKKIEDQTQTSLSLYGQTTEEEESKLKQWVITKIEQLSPDDKTLSSLVNILHHDAKSVGEFSSSSISFELDEAVRTYGPQLISSDEFAAYEQLWNDNKQTEAQSYLESKAQTAVTISKLAINCLCHALHSEENELNSLDAYHLGLVDEISGIGNLPSLRSMHMRHNNVTDNSITTAPK